MEENKITQSFLDTAYDVLAGKADTFHEQAIDEYFDMWLNDEIQLEDVDNEKIANLYNQFENNEITEKQLKEGIGSLLKKGASAVGRAAGRAVKAGAKAGGKLAVAGVKKAAQRVSTQGRIDAGKKKIVKIGKKKELKQVKKDIKTAKAGL